MRTAVLALALAGCAGIGITPKEKASLAEDKNVAAPDIEGVDQDGKRVVLSELARNGRVVLVFYRGHW